jgi:hypothetical protein
MSKPERPVFVFLAENTHAAECGDPPGIVDADPKRFYVGYFHNGCGEQWVFVYDRKTGRGTLRGGDTGWAQRHRVVKGMVASLVLNAEEMLWLRACWAAATGEVPEVVSPFTEAMAGIAQAFAVRESNGDARGGEAASAAAFGAVAS